MLGIYTKLINGKIIQKAEEAVNYDVNEQTIQRDIEDIRNFLEKETEHTGIINSVVYDRVEKEWKGESNMNIYDKARWQIDDGIEEKLVIEHFSFMFNWLDEFNLLNEYGRKIKNSLIDEEIVLTDEMLNHSGKVFDVKY